MVKVGDWVIYVDEKGQEHNALVTCVFSHTLPPKDEDTSINVVIVNPDPNQEDSYGRKMLRETSVVHKERQPAHGQYWNIGW